MYYYTIFDHTLMCDFYIPEAIEINPIDNADIIVERKCPPDDVIIDIKNGRFDRIGLQRAWFYVNELAVFYIENGNHIMVHEMGGGVDDVTISTFLTGLAMAICLTQRGLIPVHGGVVCANEKGFIITGTSGSGKSSTTTKLREMGATFMADDIGVVDVDSMEVLPGFPVQKLCGDMVEKFQLDKKNLRYIGEQRDKYAKKLDEEQYLYERRPLKAIFEIKQYDGENLIMEEIDGTEKLKIITNNIFCEFYVSKFPMQPADMIKYLEIAKKVEIYRVYRPKSINTLQEIVEWIWEKMKY